VACKSENDVPIGVNRTWVKYIEKGEFPNVSRHFAVLRCNHCDDAPCVEICPTVALFRRPDGIVDFDGDRCIGCKSCMQACPYDALYINPDTNTAAKCNFCAHRVETGLKPACEVVCPTQAIISGDLDNPASAVSRYVATEKVMVRKPEKATRPKLFYAGVDGDLLQPARMRHEESFMWADKSPLETDVPLLDETEQAATAREVYDVPHPEPWGRMISSYLWTKSIAAGVLLVTALLFSGDRQDALLTGRISPAIAVLFVGITSALLILDLKRPERFLYLLFKPNFRSWLVWGGYLLIGYGAMAGLWLLWGMRHDSVPGWIVWPSALLAVGSAGYSAFLFAQAKARDLWQSPLFLWHLLAQAVTAGTAVLLLSTLLWTPLSAQAGLLQGTLAASLILALALILGELFLTPASEDVGRALGLLKEGAMSGTFWGLAMGLGFLLPLTLLLWARIQPDADAASLAAGLASVSALAGLWFFEDHWIRAGQAVPLS